MVNSWLGVAGIGRKDPRLAEEDMNSGPRRLAVVVPARQELELRMPPRGCQGSPVRNGNQLIALAVQHEQRASETAHDVEVVERISHQEARRAELAREGANTREGGFEDQRANGPARREQARRTSAERATVRHDTLRIEIAPAAHPL